jgi:uncharacterized membrane protein
MEKATKVAQRVLMGSAGLALVLGLIVWISGAYELIGLHELLGYALVASLWTLAAIAARSGVGFGFVVGAFAWGVLVLALGWGQEYLLEGDSHWVVQVAHPVISMASVPWGKRLVAQIRRNDRVAIPREAEGSLVPRGGHAR